MNSPELSILQWDAWQHLDASAGRRFDDDILLRSASGNGFSRQTLLLSIAGEDATGTLQQGGDLLTALTWGGGDDFQLTTTTDGRWSLSQILPGGSPQPVATIISTSTGLRLQFAEQVSDATASEALRGLELSAGAEIPALNVDLSVAPPPIVAAYFPEWGIYGRDFQIADVPADKLTHLIYAFAKIDASGRVALFDSFAATDKRFTNPEEAVGGVADQYYYGEGDPRNDQTLWGNFNQIAALKELHPHLRTSIAIGGWTLSGNFSTTLDSAAEREIFADSVVDFLSTYTMFDGVDFDWEYPGGGGLESNTFSPADGVNYAATLEVLREKLDDLERRTGRTYEISMASAAGSDKIPNFNLSEIKEYVDFFNLMSYDFHGTWESSTGHQAALRNDPKGYDIETAVDLYLEAGVEASRIVLGAPAYTRAWKGVENSADDYGSEDFGYGDTAAGAAAGSFEAGSYDYKDLLAQYRNGGWELVWDDNAQAAYLWNPSDKIFSSFETPSTIALKSAWAKEKGLGGMMFWDLSNDANGDPESLIDAASASWLQGQSFASIAAASGLEFDHIVGGNGLFDLEQVLTDPFFEEGSGGPVDGGGSEPEGSGEGSEAEGSGGSSEPEGTAGGSEPEGTGGGSSDGSSDGGVMASLSLTSQWSGSFEGQLHVTNTTNNAINAWTASLISRYELRAITDFTVDQRQQADGTWHITLSPPSWGAPLQAGASLSAYVQGTIPAGGQLESLDSALVIVEVTGSEPATGTGGGGNSGGGTSGGQESGTESGSSGGSGEESVGGEPGDGGLNSGNAADALWGEQFFAPYVDMTLYPTPDLDGLARAHGVGLLTLGFVQATPDGEAAWAGLPSLALTSQQEQALAIRSEIEQLRQAGGDVMVSLGGATGTSLAQSYAAAGRSAAELAAAYGDVIDSLGLNRVDFDIEGAAIADQAANQLNSEALRLLGQSHSQVEIWFTLPVLPQGLTGDGLQVVTMALEAGVSLDGINVMAMNYGSYAAPPEAQSMGAYAIDAATNTHAQLSDLFAAHGQTFGWNQLGVTPMIGVNDITTEVFTTTDAQLVEDFARQQGLGMLSMWSLGRDQPGSSGQVSPTHSGTQAAGGSFTEIWGDYGSDPVISGGDGGNGEGAGSGSGDSGPGGGMDGGAGGGGDPITNPGGDRTILVEGSITELMAEAGSAERFQLSYAWGRQLTIHGFDPGEDVLDLTAFWGEGQQARVLATPDGAQLSLPFNEQMVHLPGVAPEALGAAAVEIWQG